MDRLTNQFIVATLRDLTDGIFKELQLFYPEVYSNSMLSYTYAMYSFLNAWLDEIADIEPSEKKDIALKRFAHHTSVEKFSGTKSMEIAYEKNFDDICIVMNQNYSSDIREKTVREFYALYDFLQKQSHELPKSNQARK